MNSALFTFKSTFHTHNSAGTTNRKQFGMSQYVKRSLNVQGSVFSPAEHESRATERMPDDRQAPNCILYLFYLCVQTVGRDRWKAKFKP